MWKKSLILLIVIVLSGCGHRESGTTPQPLPTPTLEDQFMDKSILTGEPCEAPCWYGLEAGQSTRTEVLDVVSSLSFIDPEETTEEPWSYWDASKQELLSATLLRFECKQPKYSICASAKFVNDELKSIGLYPNYYLCFQEVVEHLGAPDYVNVSQAHREPLKCDISLEWSQRMMYIYSASTKENPIYCSDVGVGQKIDPNLPVHGIIYALAESSFLVNTPDPNEDFPWAGFIKP